jgi:Fe-S cluster biogenesis protein NfuA
MDMDQIQNRLDYVNRMVALHGGHVELASVSGGTVKVRFQGLCAGCMLRPTTLNALVRPALCDVPGVETVEGVGFRLSDEAEARSAVLRDDKTSLGAQYGRLVRG